MGRTALPVPWTTMRSSPPGTGTGGSNGTWSATRTVNPSTVTVADSPGYAW